MIIAADVGGTFTDIVAIDGTSIIVRKVPTSADPADALGIAVRDLAPEAGVDLVVHGTTVATNALLERAGARTSLVTDTGFEDIIEIARQDRPSLYDPYDDRPEPLVRRSDRVGVSGDDVPDLGAPEAVAIALVRGHAEPDREAAIARAIRTRHPDVPISCSSIVAPEFREFERTSTTVLNAYLAPITSRYLRRLDGALVGGGLARSVSVMRSSGGLMTLEEAARLPAAILLSGPAGGVVAARDAAASLGIRSVVSFDMGGTSTDVCLIVDGDVDVSFERSVAGYACRLPAVGVHTVGAGGGSIAWIDAGGALRVGPHSAGSHPGPACYARGGREATVTDANVVLGRIDPEARLGGTLDIDPGLAHEAVQRIAERIGSSPVDAALGILAIAEETMAGAVRSVSVARGHDPSGSHLVAFGGAGGLHAAAVARRLAMSGVVVPSAAGVLSAVGLVLSPPRADAVRAVVVTDGDLGPARIAAEELLDATRTSIDSSDSNASRTEFQLDVRYLGQAHEIVVSWHPDEEIDVVSGRFAKVHHERYGFDRSGDPIEVVAVRATSVGRAPLDRAPTTTTPAGVAPGHRRVVGRDGIARDTAVVDRSAVTADEPLRGPAVIEERDTTIFVDHDERVSIGTSGSLEVMW